MRRWLTPLLAVAALALPPLARAVAYDLPNNMPPGCTRSGSNYTCPAFNLGYGDTVTVSTPKPATVTITGNFGTDTSQINQAGTASDLTLIVNGTLTLGYQARIKANITANAVNDAGGGNVVITGNLTANANGNIGLAYQTTVSGNVSTSGTGTITTPQSGSIGGNVSGGSGAISISEAGTVAGSVTGSGSITVVQSAIVSGNVAAGAGSVSLGFRSRVNGNLSTTGTITAGQESVVGGSITGGAGNVSVGYAATVTGTLTTSSGTISFEQNATASSCVKSTGSASITLGYQSNINSVCCGSSCSTSCVVNNSTYAMPPACAGSTALVADYRMDETTAWNGTAAEVKDASGNGYHGQSATASTGTPVAITASGSPAYGTTSSGSCGYGLFNRSTPVNAAYTYAQLPSSFPSMTGSFTVLAWIRSTSPTQSGQRILANDDNQNGWALSLGDAGSASLRLFNRNLNASGSVTTGGSNGTGASNAGCSGGTFCLDSAPIIAANTWYYIAATVDTVNKQVQTFIYNTSGTLLASASSAFTGSWVAGSGGTSIGGESASSSEGQTPSFHFVGNIDELQVYTGLLSNSAITTQLSRSRSCPVPAITSFTISGTGSASTCSPQTLTITAKDSNGATLTGYTGTINLSTSSGGGDWAAGTGPAPSGTLLAGSANSGLASYTFAAGDAGVVRLRLTHSLAQNVTVTAVDSAVPATSSTSAAITYRDNAFVWTEDAGNLVAGSFVAVAGRNHDMRVSLWKKDTATGNCSIATDYTGSRNLKLWRTDNAGPWTAPSVVSPALSVPASRPAANNLTLSFTNGVAGFNLATTNVGKYAFSLDDDSLAYAAITVSGSSTDLTVRPFTLAVTGLTASGTANPGVSVDTGSVFAKAGAPFSATVTAYRWSSGADANNDGVPDTGVTLAQVSAGGAAAGFSASVSLTPLAGSQTPAGGVLGTLANNVLSGFSSGAVTAANVSYSEVGSFLLNTSAVVGNYLGTSGLNLDALVFNAAGSQQPRVGRFIPAGFDVSGFTVTHRNALACTPASSFSYEGEPMTFAFTLTARNAAGATTQNYTGAFAKLSPTNTAGFNVAGISGSTLWKPGGRMTTKSAGGSWSNGVANISLTATAERGSAPDGPHPNAQFGIAPVDSDNVAMLTLNLDTDAPADGADRALLGQVPLRYGRLRLQNAIGAANRVLRLPLTAQYWDSATSTYKTNDLDSCTRITAANLSFGNLRKGLTTADVAMNPATVTVNPTQPAYVTLAAPGGGRAGSLDVAIALGASSTDASCLGWTPAIAATAGANLDALRGAWCGSSATRDPSARASWGAYRGADGVLYQRENY